MKRIAAAILLALACAPASSLAQSNTFDPFTVSDIRVDGLQRISSGTVFTYLPIERGDVVDKSRAAEAIRALFRTGFFNDVSLSRQGDILVVQITERPAINQIILSGNKDIKSEELLKGLKDIGLSEGETFDRLQLERVTQELVRQYNNRGKYNVSIDTSVSDLDRNRVDVTINVKEGKAAKIKHINIVGNETFSDEEILDSWESDTTNWLSWYRRDDQYSREKLSGDLEKLNSYYLDRGYVDFNVESTQVSISPDRREMYLTANIREGEVYTVDEVKISGDTIIPVEELNRLVLVRNGDTFSRRLLELTSDSITAVLSNIGYAFASVQPIPEINREKRTVSLNFFVEPGKRVYVRRVLFKGNTRTSDEVIRREMRQFEGMWFSQAAIDRSKIRLQRLGFFEDISIETPAVTGTDDQVDVVISMKERTSGSFVFGLGYSQLSGLITSVSVQQNNFFGTGNRVAFTVQNNDFVKRVDFSYLDPYFTDDGVSLGYNLIYRELDSGEQNVASFTSDNGALQAVFGIPLTETDTIGLVFGIDRNQINLFDGRCPANHVNTPPPEFDDEGNVLPFPDPPPGFIYCNLNGFGAGSPQPFIDYLDALGSKTFNAWRMELSWARDSRNAFFNPTRGAFQRIGAEVTLPGSTVEYYKLNYQFARYWPLSTKVVLLTAAEIGYGDSYGKSFTRDVVYPDGVYPGIEDDDTLPDVVTVTAEGLPFFENFYAGGVRSIRGFEDNTLGPTFTSPFSSFRQPLGGSFKTTGTLELIFPTLLDSDTTRVSAFFDFGNVFADFDAFDVGEFRASAGVALQWQAPIGPIVLNLSTPIKKKDDDQIERLQFTFGTQF
ncbi:outer membrane protein assembly factor BamA [Pseudoxanthomonas sp. CAU 1598]|uniref:Outer membrane protein assembly factor BamA n=1 Tax=Pseudomarimonas arenosa TaxID=2774145 RepID=A0AAW3ZRQ4_9GAMM|nr:outer membrane protein assembly factor BamA [Pseudomarimonas arenosa]MBD8527227.1 outer membrane protein assembly factor BamA [Pseudomarimonas arenosa]